MNHLACCCSSCKPRYKRLVDHIYPRIPPFDAPISGNMQKLTFYSISHPEKLNRIGIYLVQRLSRDLGRQRVADVKVAVDAMEHLLKSCHGSPSLNQFIESYLLMVQRLLETNDAQMEKLATDLFVRFSGIEEDSPSYHRQYDFFISKFSSMCHANQGGFIRSQRFNGLRGLRDVKKRQFRPLAMSQSMGTSIGIAAQQQQAAAAKGVATISTGAPSFITVIVGPEQSQTGGERSTLSSSTSGGLMFSSPLNTRRNLSSVEISGMISAGAGQGQHALEDGTRSDPDLEHTLRGPNAALSKQNSGDTTSIGSSSVDWSPPESNMHSRRNTVLGGQQKQLDLPITVEQLRILANTPLDLAEEERLDQERSREVLKLFRNKDAKELSALFRKAHRRQCSCSSTGGPCTHQEGECAGPGEETLAQTLARLNVRHDEKTKIRMFGQQAPPATIFDIKFPSSFEF